jgi:ketosteroid isomerase-like protein
MSTLALATTASKCLEAWSSGDFATTRSLLADDVTFTGPMGHTKGVDAYVRGVSKMAETVTGVELKKLIVEGDDVCIMYDVFSDAAGPLPTVGWYHFGADEKIDSVRAYFDPRPLTEQHVPSVQDSHDPVGIKIPLFNAGLQVCPDVQ